jgi:hypothetical protein
LKRAIIKRLSILTCLVLVATPPLFAAEPGPALETQKEKESYSIGYQVGQSMKTDGVEVDFDRLIQGLPRGEKFMRPSSRTPRSRRSSWRRTVKRRASGPRRAACSTGC